MDGNGMFYFTMRINSTFSHDDVSFLSLNYAPLGKWAKITAEREKRSEKERKKQQKAKIKRIKKFLAKPWRRRQIAYEFWAEEPQLFFVLLACLFTYWMEGILICIKSWFIETNNFT